MKATQLLHDLGQSIWLDNITHDLLDAGTLKAYRHAICEVLERTIVGH